jgi:hypothetical protein
MVGGICWRFYRAGDAWSSIEPIALAIGCELKGEFARVGQFGCGGTRRGISRSGWRPFVLLDKLGHCRWSPRHRP